jgi:hypothetical protein
MLPSEVAARATTYDLMVTDVLASYETYEYYKSQNKAMPVENMYDEKELIAMMEKARE